MNGEIDPVDEASVSSVDAGEALQTPDEAAILEEALERSTSSGIAGKIATGVLYGALTLLAGLTVLTYASPTTAAGLSESLPAGFFGEFSVDDRSQYSSGCCKGACPSKMESIGPPIDGDS